MIASFLFAPTLVSVYTIAALDTPVSTGDDAFVSIEGLCRAGHVNARDVLD